MQVLTCICVVRSIGVDQNYLVAKLALSKLTKNTILTIPVYQRQLLPKIPISPQNSTLANILYTAK